MTLCELFVIIERFDSLIEKCLFLCLGADAKCTSLTYKCSNNKCVSKQNPECDGTEDCEDGSDEANCGTSDKPEAFFLGLQMCCSNKPRF